MSELHICRTTYDEVKQPVRYCETCNRRCRMLYVFRHWYGGMFTCLTCGERYGTEEGRMERPFARGWRKQSAEKAKRFWRGHGRKELKLG